MGGGRGEAEREQHLHELGPVRFGVALDEVLELQQRCGSLWVSRIATWWKRMDEHRKRRGRESGERAHAHAS